MTAADIALLKAEIAFLWALSPTKGPAPGYSAVELARYDAAAGAVLARVSARLYWNTFPRRA